MYWVVINFQSLKNCAMLLNMADLWLNMADLWLNMADLWLNMADLWLNVADLWINVADLWLNVVDLLNVSFFLMSCGWSRLEDEFARLSEKSRNIKFLKHCTCNVTYILHISHNYT